MTKDHVLKVHTDVFYATPTRQNYAAFEELYSGDYMLVPPDGSVLNKQEALEDLRLIVTQRLNRIKICGAGGRITSGDEAHDNGEGDGACDQPQGQNEECAGRAALAENIDIGSKVDHLSDEPAQRGSHKTTEESNNGSFDEKDAPDMFVARANGFHDSDFARSFEY